MVDRKPTHCVVETSWIVDSCFFIDVDYCQFSDWGSKKPTRLWVSHSLSKVPNMVCDPHTCSQMIDGKEYRRVHREHLGGKEMKVSARQKERMPSALLNYLLQGVLFLPQFGGKDGAGGPFGQFLVGKNLQRAFPVAVFGRPGC